MPVLKGSLIGGASAGNENRPEIASPTYGANRPKTRQMRARAEGRTMLRARLRLRGENREEYAAVARDIPD